MGCVDDCYKEKDEKNLSNVVLNQCVNKCKYQNARNNAHITIQNTTNIPKEQKIQRSCEDICNEPSTDYQECMAMCNSPSGGKPKVRKGSLEACTVAQLKEKCAKKGIKYSGLRKGELIAVLRSKK